MSRRIVLAIWWVGSLPHRVFRLNYFGTLAFWLLLQYGILFYAVTR